MESPNLASFIQQLPSTLVITTVSRRLETLRLMKGKQAHSDDLSGTANYSDNSGEIGYDSRNIDRHNDYTNVENGANRNKNNGSDYRNTDYDQYFR